jgi:ribosomal protein S18 acetylase RimI-like enzyme
MEESMVANNLTSTLSVVAGASNTTVGNATRSTGGRLPAFAYGFAQLYPSFSSTRMGRHWIVNDLFIHPSVRNRGIGSLLLTHVKKFAQDSGATGMELSTQVNNLTAQKLYSRLEWRKDTDFVVYTQKL